MYSRFQLAKKYLNYLLTASNGKGHGIHSPFVFDFIIHVLNDKGKYPAYSKTEAFRKRLLQDNSVVEVEDFGAGSAVLASSHRKVSDIARSSLKPKKFAQLLHRIVTYYSAETIVELGTSLGITTMYLASAEHNPEVYTLEGAPAIAGLAKKQFAEASLSNIRMITGNFDHTLSQLTGINPDLLFIDGNHRKEPTLHYFNWFLKQRTDHSIFIFDDIHWSAEMEDAWETIKEHPEVTLTIDLFFIGLVFFRKDFKVKQHFTIRF